MKKEELMSVIQKELEGNPQTTSIDISKKHRIPLTAVHLLRRIAEKRSVVSGFLSKGNERVCKRIWVI